MRLFLVFIAMLITLLYSCATRQTATDKPTTPPSAPTACPDPKMVNINGVCLPDSDGDLLPNDQEKKNGTDPLKADTDSDGYDDFCEKVKGTVATDASSKPTDCNFASAPAPDLSGIDQALKTVCILYDAQKKQSEWMTENVKVEKKCATDPNKKDGQSCEMVSNSLEQGTAAKNLGIPEDAELKELKISVSWGVSYKDVLMISNGVMTIRPWFTYFGYYWESNTVDNRQYDHHLGDLPSTSAKCDTDIQNKAKVKINDREVVWDHPAFMPFKISEYSNVYPFSYDGLITKDDTTDNIDMLGSVFNDFNYPTHLIAVRVLDDYAGEGDTTDSYTWDNYGNCDGHEKPCRYDNSLCKTRTVEFTYSYYKTKTDEDSFSYDYKDIETQCAKVLGTK